MADWISTAEQRENAWKFCAGTIERHFDERLKRWNAELDMLLVFAGLFSTALTAFIVQSYPLLQPDNTDAMVIGLAQISNQLNSFSVSPGFVNSTERGVFSPQLAPFIAPRYAIWVNGLWFSSLICTLSASSVAVMVKQWLHQYSQSLSGTSPDLARLRQYRYDSLHKWQVHPQALIFLLLAQGIAHFMSRVLRFIEHHAQEAAQEVLSRTSRKYIILARTRDAARRALKRVGAFEGFHSWHSREKPDAEARHAELEQSLALTAYYITLDNAMINTTVIPCLSGMDALSAQMSIRYGNLLRDITARLPSREWKVWRPLMPFTLVVLSLITREPSKGLVGKVLLAMPRSGQPSALKTKLGMLYLLAMSQLVSRRIAAREAFQNMVVYLQDARIDAERSTEPARAVLGDVEAAFPMERGDLEELVNLDKFESVSYYLTGIEYIIKYLLRHRTKVEVPDRIKAMLTSFGMFLCSPAWRTQRSRQGVVLWALRYSRLPPLIRQMTLEKQIPDALGKSLLHALKETVVVIENGYLAPRAGVEQVVTQGAKLALSLIQSSIKDAEPSQHASAHGTALISSRKSTSSEPQESTAKVGASESAVVKDSPMILHLPATPKLQIAIPRIHVTPPSIDLSWDEEQSEATTPCVESLLEIINPEFAFMGQESLPTDQVEDVVPDSAFIDPGMLQWRTSAPAPESGRCNSSSGGLTATGQHVLRIRAASRHVTLPVRKPPPQEHLPIPPRSPGSSAEIEMDIVEQSQRSRSSKEEIV